uniref:NADH-ubiquinone oxidoreductase chain 6 n=1 Tax=Caecilia tentaculata TaxID=356198 RepID=W5RGY0_CAETE|nr:NADH dehydrogenase subunit 6 [Caecilia tentaculata]AGZ18888.1 NADH dehydrogenase subunit 6 [Caecilia tentaculata]
MSYVMFFGLVGVVLGLMGVASNPSPYYAAFGLVVAAGFGCLVLVWVGVVFLSLILFLIYLGGMLVVFAYSTAMASESYPVAWGDWTVVSYVVGYLVVLMVGSLVVEGVDMNCSIGEFLLVYNDWGGVSMLYSVGGMMLLVLGWVLLLTLFIVLEVTRGWLL